MSIDEDALVAWEKEHNDILDYIEKQRGKLKDEATGGGDLAYFADEALLNIRIMVFGLQFKDMSRLVTAKANAFTNLMNSVRKHGGDAKVDMVEQLKQMLHLVPTKELWDNVAALLTWARNDMEAPVFKAAAVKSAGNNARYPESYRPEQIVGALSDKLHKESGKLLASGPIKPVSSEVEAAREILAKRDFLCTEESKRFINEIVAAPDQPVVLSDVKPGTLPIDVDATLEALRTQYQFCADAIIPRASQDAPTLRQLGLIRDAHLNLYRILSEIKNLAAIPMRESGSQYVRDTYMEGFSMGLCAVGSEFEDYIKEAEDGWNKSSAKQELNRGEV